MGRRAVDSVVRAFNAGGVVVVSSAELGGSHLAFARGPTLRRAMFPMPLHKNELTYCNTVAIRATTRTEPDHQRESSVHALSRRRYDTGNGVLSSCAKSDT